MRDCPEKTKLTNRGTKCNYQTDRIYNLQRHYRTLHTNQKPFKCNWEKCSYATGEMRDLARHYATHTNLHNFICPECSYATNRKDSLMNHMKISKTLYVDDSSKSKIRLKRREERVAKILKEAKINARPQKSVQVPSLLRPQAKFTYRFLDFAIKTEYGEKIVEVDENQHARHHPREEFGRVQEILTSKEYKDKRVVIIRYFFLKLFFGFLKLCLIYRYNSVSYKIGGRFAKTKVRERTKIYQLSKSC